MLPHSFSRALTIPMMMESSWSSSLSSVHDLPAAASPSAAITARTKPLKPYVHTKFKKEMKIVNEICGSSDGGCLAQKMSFITNICVWFEIVCVCVWGCVYEFLSVFAFEFRWAQNISLVDFWLNRYLVCDRLLHSEKVEHRQKKYLLLPCYLLNK